MDGLRSFAVWIWLAGGATALGYGAASFSSALGNGVAASSVMACGGGYRQLAICVKMAWRN